MSLERGAKERQVKELEKLVFLMTNSALAAEDETNMRKLKKVMQEYL
jgi:hypothetical protein